MPLTTHNVPQEPRRQTTDAEEHRGIRVNSTSSRSKHNNSNLRSLVGGRSKSNMLRGTILGMQIERNESE